MIQFEDIEFGELDADGDLNIMQSKFYYGHTFDVFLSLQEVIKLRNYLTSEINRVQKPIADFISGNANVSKT